MVCSGRAKMTNSGKSKRDDDQKCTMEPATSDGRMDVEPLMPSRPAAEGRTRLAAMGKLHQPAGITAAIMSAQTSTRRKLKRVRCFRELPWFNWRPLDRPSLRKFLSTLLINTVSSATLLFLFILLALICKIESNIEQQISQEQQQQQQREEQETFLNQLLSQEQSRPMEMLSRQGPEPQTSTSVSQSLASDQAMDNLILANSVNEASAELAAAPELKSARALQADTGGDLLVAAQSKSSMLSGDGGPEKQQSGGGGSSGLASSSVQSSSTSSSSSSSSSSSPSSAPSSASSALAEQLSAVSSLIQQAGQLGLTAAQQNVALSEAIINGVTNSLIRNTQNAYRNRQQQAAATSAPANSQQQVAATSTAPLNAAVQRPGGGLNVGQSIDGDISYDPEQNAINGFINFPNFPNLNFSNLSSKPSIGGAMKPLFLAAIKTVPVKLGSVGWKLLQLLAWKKIYKAHHPKSGEIIIEQEMKHSGSHLSTDKSAKLAGLSHKIKTSKMGQTHLSGIGGAGGGGGFGANEEAWMSMMRSAGLTNLDPFGHAGGGNWPQATGEMPTASASMLYQRHLLPPGVAQSMAAAAAAASNGAGGQPAAAAAAAAAATAAAIQSHWLQQQQNMMSESETDGGSNQQTRSMNNSTNQNSAHALTKRKKASYGGANWFATTPAQAYAAAAAAASAAANMASQQQQHQQRIAQMMRAYEYAGADPMQMVATGQNGGGLQPALAGPGNGLIFHNSLFDNAAALAVQNAVKLPTVDLSHHSPLASADFLDQSDSLTGSPFGSFSSLNNIGSMNEAIHESMPMTLMQRNDQVNGGIGSPASDDGPMGHQEIQPSSDNLLTINGYHRTPVGHMQGTSAALNALQDFDDTPAGKMLDNALNGTTSYPIHRLLNDRYRFR